jgi:ABC-type microcin C transport system permease subunit YejE
LDDTVKLTSISVVLGIIAGILSGIFSIGMLGFKNDFIGLIIAIVIVYVVLKSTDKIVTEEMGRSQKIWDCFMPFFFSWILVWVLLSHYL